LVSGTRRSTASKAVNQLVEPYDLGIAVSIETYYLEVKLLRFIFSLALGLVLVSAEAGAAGKHNCPAGTAWSNYNQQCSRHNWCWQKLGLASSSQNPTGAALAKLEACKARG
jgi:hypothetical protein